MIGVHPPFRLLTLLTGIVLSGCASTLDLIAEEKDLPRPSEPVVQSILHSLREREALVASLQAVLDLTVRYGGTQTSRQVAVAVQRPDLIRLESVEWGGLTSAVLLSDGRRLVAHALLQNLFGEGRATPENVAAITGLYMAPSHLVRLLLGLPPLPLRNETAVLYGPDGDRAYLLREQDASFTQRLWLSDDGLNLLKGELYHRTSLRVRFQYAPMNYGARLLLLEEPVGRMVIEISYRSYNLNPDLPRDLFQLPQPDQGAQVMSLDAWLVPLLRFP